MLSGINAEQFIASVKRKNVDRLKVLDERAASVILDEVICDLRALPSRTFANQEIQDRALARLRYLRGRLADGDR